MPRSLVIFLPFAVIAFASCTPAETTSALEINITRTGFVMRGTAYKSQAELASALKSLKPPAAISLKQEPGTTAERRTQVLAAISEAGIKAPVAIVGNEVFSK